MVNTAVSLFVFLLAWIWQHRRVQVLLGAQSSHLELARDGFCSWDFHGCKVPSHPEGPAFPSEKNLPANWARKGGAAGALPTKLPPGQLWYHEHSETKHQIQSMSPFKKIKDI